MESRGDEENTDFSDVIENLMNMFGNVMSSDVISAVVESCDGDLNLSVDAIMNMTNDGNVISGEENQPTATSQNGTSTQSVQLNQPAVQLAQPIQPLTSYLSTAQPAQPIQSSTSYVSAAQSAQITKPSAAQPTQNTGAIPKQTQRPVQYTPIVWTNQIKEIITHYNEGNRILILMRGVPGSGKSYLAQQIIDITIGTASVNYKKHIFSTDDYFMVGSQYRYDKYKLSEAHLWNQNRARNATKLGLSPVIIDNTNIELWEMEPYLRDGVKYGYIIEILEPTTPWAKKANHLARKNTHNVPFVNIKRMLDNYRSGIDGETLRQTYRLSYPTGMVPPVKRTMPPILKDKEESPVAKPDALEEHTASTSVHTAVDLFDNFRSQLNDIPEQQKDEKQEEPRVLIQNDEQEDFSLEEQKKLALYLEAQKKLEEIEKFEKEWENGDNWDTDGQGAVSEKSARPTTPISVPDAKPQRKPLNMSPLVSTSLMPTVNDCQDWSKIYMFMSPWIDSSEPSSSIAMQEVPVEKKSSGTSMEIGDTNINGKNKVITATPRNINEFHISFSHEKIPQKRMLDKSSMTNEDIMTEAFRCSNEEKHFIAFRKLFKNIARSDLRDIFDKCCGDVNWSVEIVLDGMNNNQFKTIDIEELSDPEEESMEQCACLAKYHVIPNVALSDAVKTTPKDDELPVATGGPPAQKKKRDVTMSDENIQIKRQIEQNVVISDNHYSKHCLMIRKMRRGEPDLSKNYSGEPSTSKMSADAAAFVPNYTSHNFDLSDDEDGSVSETDEDVIINVNVGSSFISDLDEKFGREDMQYPAYIKPRISLPLSLLNEINALWMESLTFQLDEHAKQTAAMMQQDEEFARQIAMKEAELSLEGKEPEIPDFKEIMDMDMALAIYQKDVAEWRNNMPTDLAAKMTRDKLFNLFPDVSQDTLTELLMAHDNNFNATVEVLLMSTGRDDVLEQENGINKFIMTEEMKRKDQILQEQRKELSETEWPLLSEGHKVDLSTVQAYREEADQHLARRNLNYQKAQDCIRRGMTQVANYYSEIANFHKQKYEHANGLAVASLMQFHALKNPDCTTIDLHFLRVKEAKESLDVFLDTHISKLRDSGNRRKQMLFFITGRGSHSQGRARIKPATIQRLKERGLGYSLKNPGLLAAKVNGDTKLTYQVSVP